VTSAVLERIRRPSGGARVKPGRPAPPPATPQLRIVNTALAVLAVLLLSFIIEVTVLGDVRHARAQSIAYDELRLDMANGTAPVGQTDADGKLVEVGRPIALLAIPAIGLREVVFEGTTGSVLSEGPGHRRDTPYPGQAGGSLIMGRQAAYGGPFGSLEELEPGDEIAVTTGQHSHLYEVTGTRRAGDPITPLATGEGRLTLASGDGLKFLPDGVVRVDAKLVSEVVPSPALAFGSASLPETEQAMASDTGVLLPLFLWSQLLLLLAVAMVWVRSVWGQWQTWLVALPVLALPCLQASHQVAQLMPNLL